MQTTNQVITDILNWITAVPHIDHPVLLQSCSR